MKKVKIHIENLKCRGCANTIKKNLEKIDGVVDVIVHVEASAVEYDLNTELTDNQAVKSRLKSLGYPEKGKNTTGAGIRSLYSCAIGRFD